MKESPEIFVTIGNPTQPFDRLIRWMDGIAARLSPPRSVLVQVGPSRVRPKHCDWVEFIPMDRFEETMHVARVIVSHGGQGSILTALQNGRKPIVVPRLMKFGEHINDHQLEIIEEFSKRKLIHPAFTEEELFTQIVGRLRDMRPYRYEPRNKLMLETLEKLLAGVDLK